jgi:putative addiction module component (TIGR02574 family)
MEDLEKEMLNLSTHERATLAKKLLMSLDNQGEIEVGEELETAWMEEIQRRVREYERDTTIAKDADTIFKELRSKFH